MAPELSPTTSEHRPASSGSSRLRRIGGWMMFAGIGVEWAGMPVASHNMDSKAGWLFANALIIGGLATAGVGALLHNIGQPKNNEQPTVPPLITTTQTN